MGIFFKKKSLFFVIISCLFILILFYFILAEFFFERYLFNIKGWLYLFYFYFLAILYFLPIIFFILLDFIISSKRLVKYIFYFFSSIYYILLIFLVLYLGRSRLVFDWNFFICNINEAIPTTISAIGLFKFIKILFLYFILLFSMIVFFENFKVYRSKTKKEKIFKIILLLVIIFFILIISLNIGNKGPVLIRFINRTISSNSEIIKNYNNKYKDVFQYYSSLNLDNFDFKNTKNREEEKPDIYFIHLESLNNEFVNDKITPELIKYSDDYGVRFSNFFSNTIQTLRAEESILCAMPPSLNRYLNNTYDVTKLVCLPEIFNKFGYQTMFFKSYNLDSTGTGNFMKKIGFSEVHNEDIMKEGDENLEWGYREDIFYSRVLEYLEKDNSPNKFIYIAVSSTNHYPFDTSHFDGQLPFMIEDQSVQDNFIKKLSNSSYVQDSYFGQLMDKLVKDKKKKYIFIYSDNAWPIGIHENNFYNESMAYKENFSIPLIFISIGDDNFKKSKIIEDSYSQIDIFNTILDLFDIKVKKNYLGDSFYNRLIEGVDVQDGNDRNRCILSIQPFSDKFFSFIKNNIHYIYNIYTKEFIYYDLKKDINELNPQVAYNFEEIYRYCTFFEKDIDLN